MWLCLKKIDLCGLDDIGYIGVDWTFEKRVSGGQYCRVRLDRALATAGWSALFPFATLRHMVAAKSDHSPIVLMYEIEQANRRIAVDRPFRFEAMRETHQEFFPMMERTWRSQGEGSSVHDLKEKLDKLAGALASGGRNTFGHVRKEMKELKRILGELRATPNR